MHGKDLLINNGCDRQAIEAVGERFPQLDVVSSLTLIIKPVYAVDGGTFVVPAENKEVLGIFDLVCEE